MAQKTILLITDGIGYNENDKFNAFNAAKKPNFDWMFENLPNTLIKTSGNAVGLPEGQMGNSEVGHMCIGSGRILYQNLVKIDLAIKNGDFNFDENLNGMFKKCKNIHIIGLYSDGGVHSHLNHFNEIYNLVLKNNCNAFAHLITDGRDVLPKSALNFIEKIEDKINIASICGRFYAMDRDNRWDRIKLAYDAYCGKLNSSLLKPSEYISKSYDNGIFDEFIEPISFNNFNGIKQDDGLIFINFRNDRMRELVSVFGDCNFKEFDRKFIFKNIITMTDYDAKFNFPVLIKKENLKNTLSQVIADAGLSQFHTAETEKYAHVTFFFNGGIEDVLENETRLLVPSPNVKTYDEKPQMSAYEVCDAVIKAVNLGFDFIVVNFANGDMVGHTGNFNASIKAVETIDECIGKILKVAKQNNYAYIQTSDHGNCEAMKDENENILTNHTVYDVFCFVMAKGVKNLKPNKGLNNIAASVLKIMDLQKPQEMDEAIFE